VSSVFLILIDRSLALSAVGAHGSTKVLAARSLGSASCSSAAPSSRPRSPRLVETCACRRSTYQWIMNAELLPLAALTLVAGALVTGSDRTGSSSRGSLSVAGAIAVGFAPSFARLIVGQLLQGLSEALILVLGVAFPADEKGRAVGIWSAAAAVASGVAPAIAGAILDHGSWRTAFLMFLTVLAGAQGRWAKNEERKRTYWQEKAHEDPNHHRR